MQWPWYSLVPLAWIYAKTPSSFFLPLDLYHYANNSTVKKANVMKTVLIFWFTDEKRTSGLKICV